MDYIFSLVTNLTDSDVKTRLICYQMWSVLPVVNRYWSVGENETNLNQKKKGQNIMALKTFSECHI